MILNWRHTAVICELWKRSYIILKVPGVQYRKTRHGAKFDDKVHLARIFSSIPQNLYNNCKQFKMAIERDNIFLIFLDLE